MNRLNSDNFQDLIDDKLSDIDRTIRLLILELLEDGILSAKQMAEEIDSFHELAELDKYKVKYLGDHILGCLKKDNQLTYSDYIQLAKASSFGYVPELDASIVLPSINNNNNTNAYSRLDPKEGRTLTTLILNSIDINLEDEDAHVIIGLITISFVVFIVLYNLYNKYVKQIKKSGT
jgi:hypothetical protein